MQQTIESFW